MESNSKQVKESNENIRDFLEDDTELDERVDSIQTRLKRQNIRKNAKIKHPKK